jgi:hypothetical protein
LCCPRRQKSTSSREEKRSRKEKRHSLMSRLVLYLSLLTFALLSLCTRGASARFRAEPNTLNEPYDAVSEPLRLRSRLPESGDKGHHSSLRETVGAGAFGLDSSRRKRGSATHALAADVHSFVDSSGKAAAFPQEKKKKKKKIPASGGHAAATRTGARGLAPATSPSARTSSSSSAGASSP